MKKTLLDYLKELPDSRRGAGRRHNQAFSLLIIIMSIMSGYTGIRAMGDFVERNKEDLKKAFKPKNDRIPTYSTLRRIMLKVDFTKLKELFYQWSIQGIDTSKDNYYSIDGKSIRSTVSNGKNSNQNFISMVTVFCQNRKKVLTQQKYQNKKISEISIVQELIEELDLEGITLTMDALHSQKKQ